MGSCLCELFLLGPPTTASSFNHSGQGSKCNSGGGAQLTLMMDHPTPTHPGPSHTSHTHSPWLLLIHLLPLLPFLVSSFLNLQFPHLVAGQLKPCPR